MYAFYTVSILSKAATSLSMIIFFLPLFMAKRREYGCLKLLIWLKNFVDNQLRQSLLFFSFWRRNRQHRWGLNRLVQCHLPPITISMMLQFASWPQVGRLFQEWCPYLRQMLHFVQPWHKDHCHSLGFTQVYLQR